ncbi:helix-turn-helix transcriptional regulator [Rhodanobacter sp. C01]|uniref:helix-turn-helix domain-containing protein n=1 Tax=Rhodanobacter sp. C01 TaxID=1945856 RepID=UPI0009864B9B|nr:helix-turn-helix transcriptional regulator [Rhodanobacter sp. C01]OOG49133.1 transcriptional regulator [Rhodanobacter sp. C01]
MTTRPTEAAVGGELGELLRYWRGTRGKSQIELSLDTGVSQRHLSFIESGRSAPSRQTLMNIAQGLEVPFRDRNRLLLAAGFAPIYGEDAWNADEMKSVNAALERVLRQHEPFPAVVMDRYWNVFMTNASAPRFFNMFIDLEARPKPRNLLHLMFDPAGLRPFIAHWDRTAKSLIQRVHRESVGQVIDERTWDLLTTLMAYPEVEDALKPADAAIPEPTLPMIPLSFVRGGRTLNYFSMVTTVGTPQTIATQELRIECLYPADDRTDAQHRELMAGAKKP